MAATLDLSRWRGVPRGVSYRRTIIVTTGLRHLLSTRFFRVLLILAWVGGALVAAVGFLFSQAITSDGWLQSYAGHFGPRVQALASILNAFVLMYPDIVIDGIFTSAFWLHSFLGLGLSLLALAVLVPQLITRDRASNALTVYLSRPLTSADYLFGKLGIIVGVLVLLWTGPLLFGWLLSMLFAPDRNFIVYSVSPLLRALLFNGISLVALAAIALGVSALSRTSRNTVLVWIGLWLLCGFLAKTPHAPAWIQRASFTHDLGEIRQQVFRLDDDLTLAGDKLPLIDQRFAAGLTRAGEKAVPVDFRGALGGLAVFCGLSSFVFFRRLRAD